MTGRWRRSCQVLDCARWAKIPQTSGSTPLIGYNLFVVIGSLALRVLFMNFSER